MRLRNLLVIRKYAITPRPRDTLLQLRRQNSVYLIGNSKQLRKVIQNQASGLWDSTLCR